MMKKIIKIQYCLEAVLLMYSHSLDMTRHLKGVKRVQRILCHPHGIYPQIAQPYRVLWQTITRIEALSLSTEATAWFLCRPLEGPC